MGIKNSSAHVANEYVFKEYVMIWEMHVTSC